VLGEDKAAAFETHGTAHRLGRHLRDRARLAGSRGRRHRARHRVSSLLGAAITILLVVAWFSAMASLRRRVRSQAPTSSQLSP